MACQVCGAAGAKFCMPCRRAYGGGVVQVTRTAAPKRERVARSTIVLRGVERPVKRGCVSGRFVPRSRVATGCAFTPREKLPPWWVAREGDRTERPCYRTRGELLRAFVGWNHGTIEPWGGLSQRSTGGEFDAVNERYGLRGRRRVVDLRGAIEACAPRGRPFCLDGFDLATLNETAPAVHGRPFELPAVEQEWDYGPPPDDYVPF